MNTCLILHKSRLQYSQLLQNTRSSCCKAKASIALFELTWSQGKIHACTHTHTHARTHTHTHTKYGFNYKATSEHWDRRCHKDWKEDISQTDHKVQYSYTSPISTCLLIQVVQTLKTTLACSRFLCPSFQNHTGQGLCTCHLNYPQFSITPPESRSHHHAA